VTSGEDAVEAEPSNSDADPAGAVVAENAAVGPSSGVIVSPKKPVFSPIAHASLGHSI